MNSAPFQAPTLEELAPLFPNYSIDAFIAQGGMGAVYLATQTSLERQVAIKILPREFGKDKEFRDSFAAEAKAMAKLNHPNLIGVYDFGEVDGMPFIVMEYVAGKSLHDSSYGRQIDPAEASRIVLETCRGLHHAHQHDILHRDVKPANILMDPRHAEPKLGDFGLAMAASDGNDDGLIYGTPGYAAPEVYEGCPDARSDVYAAAVILYQLLTGKLPEVPYQHPSSLSKCDRRFDTLLAKALQPEAKARFQSAEEFANELEAIQKKPAVAKIATGPAVDLRRPTQLASTQKGSSGAIIGILAAVAAVAVGIFLLASQNDDKSTADKGEKQEASPVTKKPLPDQSRAEQKKADALAKAKAEAEVAAKQAAQELAQRKKQKELARREKKKLIAAQKKKEREQAAKQEEPKQEEPKSTFDHMAFLQRGRDFFVRSARSPLEEHEKNLIKIIDRLEREGKSILRDEDYITRDAERARKDELELVMEKYRQEGSLPNNLLEAQPNGLSGLTFRNEVVDNAIREALTEQNETHQELKIELEKQSANYAVGVRKQAEKLAAEGNAYDADILEQEADLAEKSFPYFLEIVKGTNPTPPQPRR